MNECQPFIAREKELELQPESCFEQSLANFLLKGGSFITLDHNSTFKFLKGDVIFPSCSGANNRSQTLWNLLRNFAGPITLMPPHATRYGFDPYNGLANWHRTQHSYENDEFIHWAGVKKCRKFGWDVFESWLAKHDATRDELQELLNYYDNNYYRTEFSTTLRRVYLTFAKNAHVHLFRLSQTNRDLKNVVLVFFPFEDLIHYPLPEWNTYRRAKQAYINLAALISKYLDFSELEAEHPRSEAILRQNGICHLSL